MYRVCMPRLLASLVAVLLVALPASAWSYKEHVLMTRLAAQRILADPDAPGGLKAFVRQHAPEAADFDLKDFVMNVHVRNNADEYTGLSYWAMHPDFDRSTPVPAFNTTEAKMHYVDLELLNEDPARRVYKDDLSNLPRLEDIPRDPDDPRYVEAGYLPFRVEQCYDQLVRAFEAGDDEAAVRWAGYLAHYLQDNTQPHHATIDFRSHSYFDHLPEDERPNVHSWMEGAFIDDEEVSYPELRAAYADYVSQWDEALKLDAERRGDDNQLRSIDPWRLSISRSVSEYYDLPFIGRRAVQAAEVEPPDLKIFATAVDHPRDRPLVEQKAIDAAYAIVMVEAIWRQAWAEAQGEYERPADARTPGLADRPAVLPGSDGNEARP